MIYRHYSATFFILLYLSKKRCILSDSLPPAGLRWQNNHLWAVTESVGCVGKMGDKKCRSCGAGARAWPAYSSRGQGWREAGLFVGTIRISHRPGGRVAKLPGQLIMEERGEASVVEKAARPVGRQKVNRDLLVRGHLGRPGDGTRC